jgi:selenocysteine-specific elongation factor
VILGTAGHIDHGKTALVKALTGVDTDRLPEERRRGITIELGFAPLVLAGVGTVGVVDVPGHEAFVRTMLAGASGIDLALLVVAADEGPMPQTKEHLAILDLLGIRAGVVALTKVDLVDADWLALVRDDLRSLLSATPLADAPIVETSVVTGAGLEALRAALSEVALRVPHRDDADLFRMPVDRAFTIRGTGTVVTGTVWSGSLNRDAVVRIMPGGREARVRGIESHGQAVERVGPGSRAAISLGGVDVAQVPRGSTLVTDQAWTEAGIIRADVHLVDGAQLGPRTRVRLHLGTRDVGARVVARPGAGDQPARIVLDSPIVARGGDRFVLRTASPVSTVGGGVITDPSPIGRLQSGRRVRVWQESGLSVGERLGLLITDAGEAGLDSAGLSVRLGITNDRIESTLHTTSQRYIIIDDRLFDIMLIEKAAEHVLAEVDTFHTREPLEAGMSLQAIRSGLGVLLIVADAVVSRLVERGLVVVDRGLLRRNGWSPSPSPAQRSVLDAVERVLHEAGREPPGVSELAATYGSEVGAVLRFLERRGQIVQVEPDRYYAAPALAALVSDLRRGTETGRAYGPSELRELLGVSRKYLIPLLEYCDRQAVTVRKESGRIVQPFGAVDSQLDRRLS